MDIDEVIKQLAVLNLRSATDNSYYTVDKSTQAALGGLKRRQVRIINIVLDTLCNKLFIDGVDAGSNTDVINEWLSDNQWQVLERKLYKLVSRDGLAFLLVQWNSEEGTPELSIVESFDGYCGAAIFEDKTLNIYSTPNISMQSKPQGKDWHVDVYYDEKIEQYTRDANSYEWKRTDTIEWVDDNKEPLGKALIAIGSGESDIADAIQTQTDYNNARLDQLATSRLQGFPREYITSKESLNILTNGLGQPLTGHDGLPIRREIERAPGSILQLPDGANYNQLNAATLDTTLMDSFIEELSLISGVPSYYLKPTGEAPSGRSLLIQEGRLNAAVETRQSELTPQIIGVFLLMLRLSNNFARTRYATDVPITLAWSSPQVYDTSVLQDRAAVIKTLNDAGKVSVAQAVRFMWQGVLSDEQIDEEIQRLSVADNALLLGTVS